MQRMKEKHLSQERLEKVDQLKEVAEKLGVSLAQLALAWCISNPNVSTVITGATKLDQVLFSPKLGAEGGGPFLFLPFLSHILR